MNAKLRIALAGVLATALIGGVAQSMLEKSVEDSRSAAVAKKLTSVRVLVGSAKFGFLSDPKLTEILASEGFSLVLTKTDATTPSSASGVEFDAALPAGANAAKDFAIAWKSAGIYQVFSTPLALASWKQLVPVLEANGLAKNSSGHIDFYLEKALPLMLDGRRWNQLKGNTAFDVNKGFLVNTPDIRMSNTGALYVAVLSSIQNGQRMPSSVSEGAEFADKLSALITRQGFQDGTLTGPFEDYVGQGMGKAPLVLVYESQFVEAKREGKLRDTHVLLYPQPSIVLKHVLVARSEAGKRLGELLSTNVEIQKIAARYGFRTGDPAIFADSMKELGLDAPNLPRAAEEPSTDVLDAITRTLVKKLEGN